MSFLLSQDNVLIELRQTGLQPQTKHGESSLIREDDPILVVHPNFVIDAWNINWRLCTTWMLQEKILEKIVMEYENLQ